VAWGKHGYRGPKPPIFIRKEHRYVFTVYALDCQLDISDNSRRDDLIDAMRGHILSEAKLLGKYQHGD
jgi:Raf kinase inhibitor-like YbhB/YbcL family protein